MIASFAVMSTRSLRDYAKKVVKALQNDPLFSSFYNFDYTDVLSVDKFADGEMEVTLHKSLRGRDVYLFANAAGNREDISIEEAKIELYHTIDALRRSQARNIIVFEPYVSASRSDRQTRRNSVGIWIHYKILVSLGMNHLVTYQMHSDKSQTIFDPMICAVDNIPASILLKQYICAHFIKTTSFLETTVQQDWLFCSVDAGGEKLARGFATTFGTQLIIAHKQRNYTKANTVDEINILSAVPLKGKTVWIVDDMIDTGGSIYELVKELETRELKEINIAIVHPVLSGKAIERLRSLQTNGVLKNIIVCDTIPCKTAREQIPGLHVVSSENMSARVISTIAQNEQMTDVFKTFNPSEYLETPRLFNFEDR